MQRQTTIELLFRHNYRALCMYAVHFLGDIDMAEDVVMDCFVRLAEKSGDGGLPDSPKSYIYRMTRNACLDALGRLRHDTGSAACANLDIVADDDTTLQERSEREARLWSEIDKLPTMCRRVFLMSKRDGKRNTDIALALGISIKTVEAHIHKAYTTLRGRAAAIYMMFLSL